MLRTILVFLIYVLPLGQAAAENDLDQVKELAQTYINATYEGDADTLTRIFHKSAVMNGYLGEKILLGGAEPFIAQMRGNPSLISGGAPYKGTIDYLDVSGDVASATITETGFGDKNFTNYFHLIKEQGEWKIISKTFVGK